MTLLAVRNLRKAFGGNTVVDGVSFSVAAGEIVALIGPNGAGKSTCFNMLNGQLQPDGGEIVFAGQRIDGAGPAGIWRAGIGRSFQVAAIFASLPVIDNVRAALLSRHRRAFRIIGSASRLYTAESLALLDRVGLAHLARQTCGTLAHGDLKRLELALAIANEPRLLLLDEPTAGMAESGRRATAALLTNLAGETGCAILLTEHDIDTVFSIADRILVLDKGILIAEGTADAIRADPRVRAAYLGD